MKDREEVLVAALPLALRIVPGPEPGTWGSASRALIRSR